MIRISQQHKTIDADDLVEILKERRKNSVGFAVREITEVIKIIEQLPDLSEREEIKDLLP